MFQRTNVIKLGLACALTATACGGTAEDQTTNDETTAQSADEALTSASNCDGNCPAAFTALWATTMMDSGKVMGQCEADVANANEIEVYAYLRAKDINGNVVTIGVGHYQDQHVVTAETSIVTKSWEYEAYRTLCHARHKKNDGTWTDYYSYVSDWK